MEVKTKTIEIKSKEDLEKVLKEENIPDEVKMLISASFENFEKRKEEKKKDKFLNALLRFKKIYEITFGKEPSEFNEIQKRLYTKALNKSSEILEHLNKEVNQYE